ncbi:hypothetical protein C4572_01760 [Candidatus Parcubacteria bacterium]|nr:MAG: hypothetical protein C4572_01760 [Candidatus Parcubacteria bacterium]
MSTKIMNVPVEKVEEAISGARKLIEDLREIQRSRVVEIDGEKGTIDDVAELIARSVEDGARLEEAMFNVENRVFVKLIERGHDDNVKLARVLGITPENLRQKLFTRGIKLKEVRKMLTGEGVVVKNGT